MKVVQLNSVFGSGSTGKICVALSDMMSANGIENYVLYSGGHCDDKRAIKIATESYRKIQSAKAHAFGNYGFNSKISTKRAIEELEKIKPDVVHIHNIHSHDFNLEMLMDYFLSRNTKLIWTFHDCWAFTAYCPHFINSGCEKWKTGCESCPVSKKYSSIKDKSRKLYAKKKSLLTKTDFTVVTPSKWLEAQVKESFLKEHPIKVIPNGIDLSVFKPTESNFRKEHGISENHKVILGVSYIWNNSKGLDAFIELAGILDRNKYKIVLLGTDEATETKLPKEIITVRRTKNQSELAAIYTAADIFVNPTREDTYPTVNMEAQACGLPVVTFKTGGSPEMILDNTGAVTEVKTAEALAEKIRVILSDNSYSREECVKAAKRFDAEKQLKEYLLLYRSFEN